MLAVTPSLRLGRSVDRAIADLESQPHHDQQGFITSAHTDTQQRSQIGAMLRMRGSRPMGRSSKDTMESPYSARLPSSLSWRQNREDTSSSGNGRLADPYFAAPLRLAFAAHGVGGGVSACPSPTARSSVAWTGFTTVPGDCVVTSAERSERSEGAIAS
jgi:hypothetical protein